MEGTVPMHSLSSIFREGQTLVGRCLLGLTAILCSSSIGQGQSPKGWTVKADPSAAEVLQGTTQVAKFGHADGPKPILWPLIGPGHWLATRQWPMSDGTAGEKQDHPHHRSLWMTHGAVNGVDFWSESPGHGSISTTALSTRQDPQGAWCQIDSTHDWMAPSNKRVLSETRSMRFSGDDQATVIDLDIRLHASDGPVEFGDTKEGSFGIRVAEWMKVDAKLGGKITSSRGKIDGDAWGLPAEWVDYTGDHQGERVGIAILCHPSSYRAPGRWHVRTYGLFAHNPFGRKDFPEVEGESREGGATLPAGETMLLAYRVILHRGRFGIEETVNSYKQYSRESKSTRPAVAQ
jgi:hypothetical protein